MDKKFKELVPGKEIRGCRVEFDNGGDSPTRARFCSEGCLNAVRWVARLHVGEGKEARVERVIELAECVSIFARFCAHSDSETRERCLDFAHQVFTSLSGKVPDATTLQAVFTRRIEADLALPI